ncbi:arf-GAP with coiled-coil, ANK repeat and PH domain-containing protein 2-like [Bolinopsis microptera]|uniref:arf-GAP with coiled-coil, ANK repeat and PH domain-containing protein 2-like n=1 Tax=Bolinopsis microptera TaxID=2820187 RepID=UPI0030797EC9
MGLSFEETVQHSPVFKTAVQRAENEITGQETRLNRLLSLLVKREEQTRQILETSRLVNLEFEQLMVTSTTPLKDTLKKYTSALQHWEESKERHNEQIRMVLIDPLVDFMQTDFKKLELRKQQYHTAVKEHLICSTEYAECKKEEVTRLHASSTTLFNANYNMTRLAARYVLQLKTFSSKRDIFLTSQLSELLTTYLTHHQLGSNIALEVESQRDTFTETLVETKKGLEATTGELKEELRVVVTRAERAQTMKLLNLQLYDLHMNEEATKTAAKLNEYTNIEEIAPSSPPDQIHGYLWVGEKSAVFGHSWYRSWCRVKDGMLVLQNADKGEQRINLKLCQVKSDAYNINRAFCFTLFSPVRPLVLQAQSSQDRETWIMIMHKAIANAISKARHPVLYS